MTDGDDNYEPTRREFLTAGATAATFGAAGCLGGSGSSHERFGDLPEYVEGHYEEARDDIVQAYDKGVEEIEKELDENSDGYQLVDGVRGAELNFTGEHDENFWLDVHFDAQHEFAPYVGEGQIGVDEIGTIAAEEYSNLVNIGAKTVDKELESSEVVNLDQSDEVISERRPRAASIRVRYHGVDDHVLKMGRDFSDQDLDFEQIGATVDKEKNDGGYPPV